MMCFSCKITDFLHNYIYIYTYKKRIHELLEFQVSFKYEMPMDKITYYYVMMMMSQPPLFCLFLKFTTKQQTVNNTLTKASRTRFGIRLIPVKRKWK